MLTKLKIIIKANQSGTIKGSINEKIHGVIFSQLKEIDSEMATRLHSEPERAFHISHIINKPDKQNGATFVKKDNEYFLYITTLNRETALIFEQWANSTNEQIYIGNTPFQYVKKEIVAKTTYQDIVNQSEKSSSVSKVSFDFLSPTSFRRNGVQIVIPEPELIFNSLLKRWNHFSRIPMQFDPDFSFSTIHIGKYNLHTELTNFSNYKIIGFKGSLKINLTKKLDEHHKKLLVILSDFANYHGVGYKTTMGLGFVYTKFE